MRLFIAEKPSLGKAIAEALPQPHVKAENCIFCGKDDVVTWSAGHILSLYEPQDYNPEHKTWRLSDIPHIPSEWKYKERAEAKSLLATISKYLKQADEVVNAGDADREGQLLIDEILNYYGYKGKTFRLLITDNNPEAIQKAIRQMKPNEEYKGLSQAGQARAIADWLLGLNLTRLYTLLAKGNNHYGGTALSVGRVQTPVLGLVVRRDEEIENFISKPFYVIKGTFLAETGAFDAIWQPKETQGGLDEKKRLLDKSIADKLIDELRSIPFGVIKTSEKKHIKKAAPLPYSLPALQIEASKKFNISPTKTLEIVQKLYEYCIVTYPRSDCQYLPESCHAAASKTLSGIAQTLPELSPMTQRADASKKHSAFNDKKIAEHFAIIPTGKATKLQGEQETIFRLIALRYIALFWPEYEYFDTKIEVELSGEIFAAAGKEIIKNGWTELYLKEKGEKEEEESEAKTLLPTVTSGMQVGNNGIRIEEKKTTPSERFTEATLLAAMGSIHRYVSNEEIKKVLKESEGIGTAATQADIINKVYLRGYAEKKGKQIISTPKGRTLIHLLPELLTQPDLTALWERRMSAIARGEEALTAFIEHIENQLLELIEFAKKGKERVVFAVEGTKQGIGNKEKDGKGAKTCPCFKCRSPLRFIDSQKGKFWVCTNTYCKSTYSDIKGKPVKPVICPKCKKNPLRKMNGKNGFFWVCSCGYTASDEKGKPQASRVCKKCGSVEKKSVAKTSGKTYWKCIGCQQVSFESK